MTHLLNSFVAYLLFLGYWIGIILLVLLAIHFIAGFVTRSVLRVIREEKKENEQKET